MYTSSIGPSALQCAAPRVGGIRQMTLTVAKSGSIGTRRASLALSGVGGSVLPGSDGFAAHVHRLRHARTDHHRDHSPADAHGRLIDVDGWLALASASVCDHPPRSVLHRDGQSTALAELTTLTGPDRQPGSGWSREIAMPPINGRIWGNPRSTRIC
jgi:hypothetical protein